MLTVAGGILEENGMILIAQRKRDDAYGLKWEFPGGKLEEGETGEECIVRELMEELGIEVEVMGLYDELAEDDLTILYYQVKWVSGKITLNDHERVQWVFVDELDNYNLLSIDREVAMKLIQRGISEGFNQGKHGVLSMSDDMVKYYSDRAKEYEEIYAWRDPDRQTEQDLMGVELKKAFKGKRVLDIGCGTGYWTQRISETAESVLGIDINEAVLEIARSKEYGCPSGFKVMDAYNMELEEKYTGTIASFMLSHVLKQDMDGWISHVHDQLESGASVFIADNTFVEGIGGKLNTKPGDPNTYKLRTLNDGSQHMIVKNYFTVDELVELFGAHTSGFDEKNVFMGKCFWWVSYQYRP